jgi:hypothetical protein
MNGNKLEVWLDADLVPQKQLIGRLSNDKGHIRFQYDASWLSSMRIPRDGGHDSMLMADSVPPSSRTPFHGDGGQHSILKADTFAVS